MFCFPGWARRGIGAAGFPDGRPGRCRAGVPLHPMVPVLRTGPAGVVMASPAVSDHVTGPASARLSRVVEPAACARSARTAGLRRWQRLWGLSGLPGRFPRPCVGSLCGVTRGQRTGSSGCTVGAGKGCVGMVDNCLGASPGHRAHRRVTASLCAAFGLWTRSTSRIDVASSPRPKMTCGARFRQDWSLTSVASSQGLGLPVGGPGVAVQWPVADPYGPSR